MSDILITGPDGNIGLVLCRGLQYPLRPFAGDARDYDQVYEQMKGCWAAIHLAWNTEDDHSESGYTDPGNYAMAQNIYRAAVANGVKRVIMASAIHADEPLVEPGGLRSPYRLPEPDSPYGASKVAVEALGRYYADRKRLEVICIRFGWVGPNASDRPDPHKPYPLGEGWLSHPDCVGLLTACLEAPSWSGNYAIIYGTSRRISGVHDLRNPFGWEPRTVYGARA